MIDVILNRDSPGGDRYARFFGATVDIFQDGLNKWISEHGDEFCAFKDASLQAKADERGAPRRRC
jgi:hypothetical protein